PEVFFMAALPNTATSSNVAADPLTAALLIIDTSSSTLAISSSNASKLAAAIMFSVYACEAILHVRARYGQTWQQPLSKSYLRLTKIRKQTSTTPIQKAGRFYKQPAFCTVIISLLS